MGLWTRSEFGDKVGVLGLRRAAAVLTAEVTCSALHEGHPASFPCTSIPLLAHTPPRDGISCASKNSCLSAPLEGRRSSGWQKVVARSGGDGARKGGGGRKGTKNQETLIKRKEKGENCALTKHECRQRPDQAAHLFTCHWFLLIYKHER